MKTKKSMQTKKKIRKRIVANSDATRGYLVIVTHVF